MKLNRLLFIGLALVSTLAFGHTELSSSMPANDATLASAPEQVRLTFSEDVTLTALSLRDSGGASFELGALPTSARREFSITAPALPPGSYMVGWRAVGADSHVVSGEIHFTVAAH